MPHAQMKLAGEAYW